MEGEKSLKERVMDIERGFTELLKEIEWIEEQESNWPWHILGKEDEYFG